MKYNKSSVYTTGAKYGRAYPSTEHVQEKQPRRSLKQWLRDYLREEDNRISIAEPTPTSPQFAKSFEGWNIRLHRANGGHIVEAWKNEDGPIHASSYRPSHELFMVSDNEDMGARLNDILVQIMLRG